MALSAPVKVSTGRTCERAAMCVDTYELQECVLTHQGPCLKSWNNLILGLLKKLGHQFFLIIIAASNTLGRGKMELDSLFAMEHMIYVLHFIT